MMTGGVTKGMNVVEMLYDGVGVGRITTGDIISTTGGTGAIMIVIAGSCPTSLSRVLDLVGAGRARIRTASLRTSLSIFCCRWPKRSQPFFYFREFAIPDYNSD